jgi:hypothetical protein
VVRFKPVGQEAEDTAVISHMLVMLLGLGVAGWGHLLLHDLFGACDAWSRADSRFPDTLQTTPSFAGAVLLVMGTMLVFVAAAG